MIACPHRSMHESIPCCQIVADLIDQPLAGCHVNDSACQHCLTLDIAPQVPNCVVASMSIAAAQRTRDATLLRDTVNRMKSHLTKSPPAPPKTPEQVPCVLRGRIKRQVECKPCQANSQLMVDVFHCPKHTECTINNTGVQPKIKGCSTCQERLPEAYQIDVRPVPQAVLDAIHEQQRPRQTVPVPNRQPRAD